jgi:hypothetical protein
MEKNNEYIIFNKIDDIFEFIKNNKITNKKGWVEKKILPDIEKEIKEFGYLRLNYTPGFCLYRDPYQNHKNYESQSIYYDLSYNKDLFNKIEEIEEIIGILEKQNIK